MDSPIRDPVIIHYTVSQEENDKALILSLLEANPRFEN